MKELINYINRMYKPSFFALVCALTVTSFALICYAVGVRAEMLAGDSELIFYAEQIFTELSVRLAPLLLVIFLVDINEKRKKS